MSVEDFIRLKAVFDNRNEQLKDLKADAESLLNQLDKGSQKITELKNGIAQKLIIVGLEEEENLEINEEHVREFKYGINKYREVEPSINYAQQRSADLNADLQALYAKAASILRGNFGDKENLADSGENCSNKEQLIEEINKVSGRLEVQNEKLAEYMSQLKELFAAKGFPVSEFDSLSQRLLAQDPDEAGEVLKNDYNVVSGQLNNTLLKIRENETILKSMAIDSDEIQKIDEELAELESKKAKLKETEHSLKMALDILTESSTEIQKDFVPALNIRMSNIIYRISGGRYKDLRADGNLYLKAIAPETGDVVSSSALSEGTVDQVYLALRIAMAELVVPTGEKLPFIMDEAFAQYDDSRTRQTFEFFKELSSERQLIFFTCKRREVDIAREVFGGSINILEL